MKGLKVTAVLLAMLGSPAAMACDDGTAGMEQFRRQTLARIQDENRRSLQASLRRNQSALLELNREIYLAQQSSALGGAAGAASAP